MPRSWNRSAAVSMYPTQYESSLQELYARPSFLNPTWRILFQEAMRGNHLLFKGLITQRSNTPADRLTLRNQTEAESERYQALIDAACAIFQSSNLAHMRLILASLTQEDRQRLFYIYKNQIRRWQKKNQELSH